jgi:hypothetical protein
LSTPAKSSSTSVKNFDIRYGDQSLMAYPESN